MMFKNLVKDLYKLWKNHNAVAGMLYSAISTFGFSKIRGELLDEMLDTLKIDSVYIISKSTDEEIHIYESELSNYSIDYDNKIIKLVINNKEVNIHY